jgi:hypothetical protein
VGVTVNDEIDTIQRQVMERYAQAHMKVAELQEAEAIFKAQAAQEAAKREEEITAVTRRTQEKVEMQAANVLRPTMLLRPDVREVDAGWTATYGDVVGSGPTPDLACQDFDRKWLGKDEL